MLAKLVKPFHFKVFFSSKYVQAHVLDKLTNVAVASVSSNNRAFDHFLGEKSCKNNERACGLLAKLLADKLRRKEVPTVYWDGVINQKSNKRKYLVEADTLWAALEQEGLSLYRDEPPSQKEIQDRRHAAKLARKGLLDKESRIDPRFRQQMWKLMQRRPKKAPDSSQAAEI